jgi:serine phosphatase RsbU (regulator of sigma subunit)/Flp pilus assembly protein TadD
MLRTLIISIFLFISLSFLAQTSNIDSLKKVMLTAPNTEKVDVILELGAIYQFTDYEKSLSYAKDALFLSKKINYEYGIALAHNNIGYSLTDLGEYSLALSHYEQSIELFHKIGEGNKEAIARNDLGYIYQTQGMVKKAIENYIESLKLLEELGDEASAAACMNNIGLLYHDQNNYKKALEYYTKSLEIKEKLGDEKAIAVSLNNIGTIYFSRGQYFEAQEYFFKSLIKRKKVDDKVGIAQCLTNISEINKNQKKYETALEYLYQAIEIEEELGNKSGIAYCLNNIGTIYRLQGNYVKAEKYLTESYNLSKDLGSPVLIKNATNALANFYKKTKDFEKAYPLLIEHYIMVDSLENRENTRKLTQTGMKYEFEKEMHIKELQQVKKDYAHEIEIKEQKIISFSFAAGLFGLIILSLVIFKSLNDKKKANRRITQQKIEIEEKSDKLEEALKSITDSVVYAKRIQEALLQTEEKIPEYKAPHFIFFAPKDIVSGDFYWSYQKDDNLYVAAVDCTGHGVPGALMSMLGITFLNDINSNEIDLSPSLILNKLREKVIKELGQNSSNGLSREGMDISLTKINFTKQEVEWAGANNPLWIVRNNELIEVKSDRQAINFSDNIKPFTNHQIKVEEGDKIYLFTDGYADQFGGVKGKKFKYKPFKELLLKLSTQSMENQKIALNNHFQSWKGNLEQVDDVCVIGLQI